MINKKSARLRRAKKTRSKIARQNAIRLSVHRTTQHFYAQIFDATGEKVLITSSTLAPEARKTIKNSSNIEAAKIIGEMIAIKAKAIGVVQVAFDRSGFSYHGRIKAFAESARANGLDF